MKKNKLVSLHPSSLELKVKHPKYVNEFSIEGELELSWQALRQQLQCVKCLRSFYCELCHIDKQLIWLSTRFSRYLREFYPRDDLNSFLQVLFPALSLVQLNINNLSDWKSIFKKRGMQTLNIVNIPMQYEDEVAAIPISSEKIQIFSYRLFQFLLKYKGLRLSIDSGFDEKIKQFFEIFSKNLPALERNLDQLRLSFSHEREINSEIIQKISNVIKIASYLQVYTGGQMPLLRFINYNSFAFNHLQTLILHINGHQIIGGLDPLLGLEHLSKVTSLTIMINELYPQGLLSYFQSFSIPRNSQHIKLSFSFPSNAMFNYDSILLTPAFQAFLKQWENKSELQSLHLNFLVNKAQRNLPSKIIEKLLPKLAGLRTLLITINSAIKSEEDFSQDYISFGRIMASIESVLPNLESIEIHAPAMSLTEIPSKLSVKHTKLSLISLHGIINPIQFKQFLHLIEGLKKSEDAKILLDNKNHRLEIIVKKLCVRRIQDLADFFEDFYQSRLVFGKIFLDVRTVPAEDFAERLQAFIKSIQGKHFIYLRFVASEMSPEVLTKLCSAIQGEKHNCSIEIETPQGKTILYSPAKGYRINPTEIDENSSYSNQIITKSHEQTGESRSHSS